MNERIKETKSTKSLLAAAGYTDVKVTHGHGTGYGWMRVKASVPVNHVCQLEKNFPYPGDETCRLCRDQWREAYQRACAITRIATGRNNNEYGGNINAHITILRPGIVEAAV